jgi:hypothetical protein
MNAWDGETQEYTVAEAGKVGPLTAIVIPLAVQDRVPRHVPQ